MLSFSVPTQLSSFKTGDDTNTLRKIEARIQADFKNGLPPHLQPNASSMEYIPGSEQSRIYVTSHSEFSKLHARDVQRILRQRLILVHGNPIDFDYGWDLDSFGRIYDVDKRTTVHGGFLSCQLIFGLKSGSVGTKFDAYKPQTRHHQGTLRELHKISTSFSKEECPPLNAISLSSHKRNLYFPCQFGSLASHEVAQSRIPSGYDDVFDVPELKVHMEWSLIGTRGTVSSLHMDSEGMGTAVVVLKGSKYWIAVTRFGEDDFICSVDSLGPSWNPYFVNEGDNANRYRFEGMHLQQGDMLWV